MSNDVKQMEITYPETTTDDNICNLQSRPNEHQDFTESIRLLSNSNNLEIFKKKPSLFPSLEALEAYLKVVIDNDDQNSTENTILLLSKLVKEYDFNKKIKITSKNINSIDDKKKGFCKDMNAYLDNRINNFYQDFIHPRKNKQHLAVNKSPGKNDVILSNNDYLCLSNHPQIVNEKIKHLSKKQKEVLMSAVFLKKESQHSKLQKKFAEFLNFKETILCQSGWSANVGLLQSIADTNTPVYIDQLAHASFWDGIEFSKAKPIAFSHNNIDRFKRRLDKYGPGILIVDSVYSTIGTICPLVEIIEIAKKHKCIVVVDESHSLGVYGEKGKGLVYKLGLTNKVDFLTASLSKAFAGRAGLIACNKKISSYFPYVANPAVFSSTLLDNEIVGLNATLNVIINADKERKKLHDNAAFLRDKIRGMGIKIASESQIITLETGKEHQTEKVRDLLENQGIFGSVFCRPATGKNHSIIRMTTHSNLNKLDLDRIIIAITNTIKFLKK